MEAHAKTQELLVDLLTVIGQSDIALWELRESVLYPKLSRDFVDMLKNLNKKKEDQVSSRFSTNKMFHEKLDEMVSRARKNKLDGVLDSPQWRHNKRGATQTSMELGTRRLDRRNTGETTATKRNWIEADQGPGRGHHGGLETRESTQPRSTRLRRKVSFLNFPWILEFWNFVTNPSLRWLAEW